MNRWLATTSASLALLTGCASQQSPRSQTPAGSLANPNTPTAATSSGTVNPASIPSAPNATIATVNNHAISLDQLTKPLVEAYGLNFLLHLAQLERAKQMAREAGVSITPDDLANERRITAMTLFRQSLDTSNMTEEEKQKEADRLLEPFLANQRLTRQEFDMVTETSAYLRKLAEPGLREKITEQHLQEGFRIMYGERVQVRHIQVRNARELAEVQRQLNDGKAFETVAAELSADERSRRQGGAIRPFSMAEPLWPTAFKEAAFALQNPGDVSQPISTGEAIHLIKLEQRIPPSSAVKYEDHKEIVREELFNRLMTVRIAQLREQLQNDAARTLRIDHPVLRRQYIDRLEKVTGGTPADTDRVRRQLELNRDATQNGATTQPTATQPTGRPEVARPPATMPAQPN